MLPLRPIPKTKGLFLLLGLLFPQFTPSTSHCKETTAPAMVAHWTFDGDHDTNCVDSSGNQHHALMDGATTPSRVDGLYKNAISLSGEHKLRVPSGPNFTPLGKISVSTWLKPSAVGKYNEIFRKEDGDKRVLFSFQDHARVLALGLNINGYVECDAPINPEQILDGLWHHCVATFDGRVMRVYLDGNQVGALERAGTISAGGTAMGFIGSSNGGECFQGAMDDLRIYRDALSAEEIDRLYQDGLALVKQYREKRAEQLRAGREALRKLNITGKSFPEMLSNTKKSLVGNKVVLTGAMASEVQEIIKLSFPDDSHEFNKLTKSGIAAYLANGDNDGYAKTIDQMVASLSEYMPLTADQWKNQSPEDLKRWKEIDAIKGAFEEFKKQGDSALFSPEWIEFVLKVGKMDVVHERPFEQEAVAPYVVPSTPETRSLGASEARGVQEEDWMHQADGNPTPRRIKDEIAWTRELAGRLKAGFEEELAELAAIEKKVAQLEKADAGLYFRVREIKRSIMFKNPAVDFDKVLFVDMPLPGGRESHHETRHRLGYMAMPGARLLVLDGLSPGGKLKQLMPQEPLHGAFWRPDISYDGKKILFCFLPHNEKSFHIYEINIDGAGLRQLTSGPYDDLDPIYLPDDEHILFSSTRGHTYVRCMPPTNAFVLTRSDRDGKNIYIISRNNEPDYLPSVMGDGRVIYTRWEYTDKPLWRAQGLWTVNPDGTQVNALWGNQSVWPDLVKDARDIPGSRRVMFTGSAHHDWFAGSVGIISPDKGSNFPDGITKITADVEWPESGDGPVDPIESPRYHRSGKYGAYYSPYPLGEKDFLVSARRGEQFMLYLMDVDGNRELIYKGKHQLFHALPVKPRTKPKVRPSLVDWPERGERPKDGLIFSNNVYEGVPEKMRGKAKHMRVLTIEAKTYTYWNKRPYLSTGPVVSGVQSEGVKRVLGTVPIEKDGSVAFNAPSGIPLHFQLLDEKYRALQTMRSFTGVMPGERRGCVGCHEQRSSAPQNTQRSIALRREPSEITPPPWGEDTVSFERYVRPVLSKYCSDCHEGDGEGRKTVDLTSRPGHLGFDETYWLLIGKPSWGKSHVPPKNPPPGWGIAGVFMVEAYDKLDPAGYQTLDPMTTLSYKSQLIELVSSGEHYDVKVDEVSRRKLIAWVDTMCPYRGDKEVREIDDPDFQGIDWLSIRPKIKTAPRIIRPGPVD